LSAAVSVPDLLRRGALAPAHVSAVDAVMGEDWARLELGRGSAVRAPADGGRRTVARRRAAIGGVLAPNPQALVKLIGMGGTATRLGLKAQMDYLSRQGDVPLRSSESTFRMELGANDAAQLAASWGLPETIAAAPTGRRISWSASRRGLTRRRRSGQGGPGRRRCSTAASMGTA
jgi:hypothetical protein